MTFKKIKMKKIICSITIFLVLLGACFEASKAVGRPFLFIDFPSIIIILIIACAYTSSRNKNYLVEFGNAAVYAGWLTLLIGLIAMSIQFINNDLNIKAIMEANSVLWLGVFYGYSIRLILSVLKT